MRNFANFAHIAYGELAPGGDVGQGESGAVWGNKGCIECAILRYKTPTFVLRKATQFCLRH